ncbi:MAG: arsenite efflux transporter metallochaperone ArsD [Akkermansiaceae bacterium]|nr:arsenite efflux transporter metallochaperone ArsD [Akkermansiaceae bacterium]MCF7732653.1 arsenite efflux transporter metallochaperone ArsD [Akkermansiaceae bacterium]
MTTTENKDLKLEVFDPPMCCSSGVCGAEVDQNLVNFAVSLQWLKMNGVQVERYNPLHQYDAFAANATVSKTANEKGIECLPLILFNGEVVSTGTYPSRLELGDMAGLGRRKAAECL